MINYDEINSTGEVPVASFYKPTLLQVSKIELKPGKQTGISYLENGEYAEKPIWIITIEVMETTEKFSFTQFANTTKEGELQSFLQKGYPKKDGTMAEPSQMYDIYEAITEHMSTEDAANFRKVVKAQGSKIQIKEFLNKQFMMGLRTGVSQESGRRYYILGTSYQINVKDKQRKDRDAQQTQEEPQAQRVAAEDLGKEFDREVNAQQTLDPEEELMPWETAKK